MSKILAIDWGRATLGLAVSDELGIEAIVVGFPKNMDGSLGPSAEAAREFARLLQDRLNIPVHLWDERLTSRAAERTLVSAGVRRRARRAVVDQVAATMILQGFLDRQRAMADRGDT